tara:strand:- start:955 stop:1371 length:417 start_codon:yes stop_codon:yes gene_type:complete
MLTIRTIRKGFKYRYIALIAVLFVAYGLNKILGGSGKRTTTNPLPKDKALEISDALLSAMDQMGTDENAIIENLKGLDLDGFNQVSNTFGKKRWVSFVGGHLSYMPWDSNLTLLGWFDKELSEADKTQIQEAITFKLF